MYISIIKAEVASKLMPVSMLSPPRLSYQYGWSFLCIVASFFSCEVAGTMAVFLFIYHHQYIWLCKHDETSLANRLFFNQMALLNLTGNGEEAKKVIAEKEEEEKRARTLPSPIQRKMSSVYGGEEEPPTWEETNHSRLLSKSTVFMGNGKPTVHGSLLEISNTNAIMAAMGNGCKCGAAAASVLNGHAQRQLLKPLPSAALIITEVLPADGVVGGRTVAPCRSAEPSPSSTIECLQQQQQQRSSQLVTAVADCADDVPLSPCRSDSSQCGGGGGADRFHQRGGGGGGGINGNGIPVVSADECSSSLPNDDDDSVEMYVCSHASGGGGGSSSLHHHHHHNRQPPKCQMSNCPSTPAAAAAAVNPQSPDVSSIVDVSGGEYPILLHSYPHHFFPHYHSGRNGRRQQEEQQSVHHPRRENGAPPQLQDSCRCVHCGFFFTPPSTAARTTTSSVDLIPLIVHAESVESPMSSELPQMTTEHYSCVGVNNSRQHRLPSIESYDDVDKDTRV